jgi:hypothetical protein
MNKSFDKNININFSDGNSLDQLKTKYDQFGNSLLEKSKNFGGGNTNKQQQYIRDEITYYKQIYDIQKKTFDEKLKQQEQIENAKESLRLKFKGGKITGGAYQSGLDEQDDKTKALLKGTGRRSWDRYAESTGKVLSSAGVNVSSLEKLLENVNLNLRQILGQEKETALQTINAIEGDEKSTLEQKMAASQARDILEGRDKKLKTPEEEKGSLLGKIFQYDNLKSLLSNVSGISNSNSALDASRKAVNAAGDFAVAGGDIIDERVGAAARVARTLADVVINNAFARYEKTNQMETQTFRNRGLSGKEFSPEDYSSTGYDFSEYSSASYGLMRSAGSSKNVNTNTGNALNLERGFGVDQGLSQSLLELTRTSKDTDKNLINIVGGIYTSGKNIFNGDRTFLGEFITKNFVGLQKSLLNNQTSVNSGTTMDILNRFNSLGGVWDAKNPNSMGNIESVNNSLRNPQGDAMKSMAYSALRQKMPGASHTEIEMEMEKGLNSPIYFKTMMEQMDQMGGNDDFKVQNLKAFGLSTTAANALLKNKGVFKKGFSQKELSSSMGGQIAGEAASNTTMEERLNAELTNKTIMGEKFSELVSGMQEVMKAAFSGATYTIDPVSGKLGIKTNVTKTPAAVARRSNEGTLSDYSNRSPLN